MNLQRSRPWLATLALSLSATACAPATEERERLSTVLSEDGYALFRVEPGAAERVAFIVEMRDVPEGDYVLLYTSSEPASAGWFELVADEFVPCRSYGEEETETVELDCLVPGGHGAIVDAFSVSAKRAPQKILRYQLAAPVPAATSSTTSSSSAQRRTAPSGYFAVMRIEKTGVSTEIAVEVRALDDHAPYDAPSVERIF